MEYKYHKYKSKYDDLVCIFNKRIIDMVNKNIVKLMELADNDIEACGIINENNNVEILGYGDEGSVKFPLDIEKRDILMFHTHPNIFDNGFFHSKFDVYELFRTFFNSDKPIHNHLVVHKLGITNMQIRSPTIPIINENDILDVINQITNFSNDYQFIITIALGDAGVFGTPDTIDLDQIHMGIEMKKLLIGTEEELNKKFNEKIKQYSFLKDLTLQLSLVWNNYD